MSTKRIVRQFVVLLLLFVNAKQLLCGRSDDGPATTKHPCANKSDLSTTECRNVTLKANKTLDIGAEKCGKDLHIGVHMQKHVPGGVFSNWKFRNVQSLRVNTSVLETIHPHFFDGLINLRQLYLQHTKVKFLHEDVFRNLTNLFELNIDHNQLESLPKNVFGHLGYLKELQLQHNQLKRIPHTNALISLRMLDLSHNHIERVQKNAFLGLYALEQLNIRSNRIEVIEEDAFLGLRKLRHLNIEKNRLRNVPIASMTLNLSRLQTLHIRFNAFTCKYLKKLWRIFVREHGITIPEGWAEPGPISHKGILCYFVPDNNT